MATWFTVRLADRPGSLARLAASGGSARGFAGVRDGLAHHGIDVGAW